MRELTEDERQLLARRRESFEAMLAERFPALAAFAESLSLPNPPMIVADPESYRAAIDEWLARQSVGEDDRAWATARLGYYIGEWLIQKFGDYWHLNDTLDTRYFGCVIVTGFSRAANHAAQVEPFLAASEFLREPLGRSLTALLNEISVELSTSKPN
jgi:hypothetical protein